MHTRMKLDLTSRRANRYEGTQWQCDREVREGAVLHVSTNSELVDLLSQCLEFFDERCRGHLFSSPNEVQLEFVSEADFGAASSRRRMMMDSFIQGPDFHVWGKDPLHDYALVFVTSQWFGLQAIRRYSMAMRIEKCVKALSVLQRGGCPLTLSWLTFCLSVWSSSWSLAVCFSDEAEDCSHHACSVHQTRFQVQLEFVSEADFGAFVLTRVRSHRSAWLE